MVHVACSTHVSACKCVWQVMLASTCRRLVVVLAMFAIDLQDKAKHATFTSKLWPKPTVARLPSTGVGVAGVYVCWHMKAINRP